ncbi:NnrS family protein (plasmid) [Photobacterium sp. DA100]|uniref:NnrS family protein n=1 Tax=Photobacterium sp. DA100 TaxID=3027472 RepID=UPI002478825E|nr:NnrS family protein [Photobacterium sp. DA100]WEM45682.1 NnrS family protein [Photobacterium sp. DA100]
MMQILDSEKEQKILPLFRLAFRPFFLAASMLSVVSMLLWGGFWAGNASLAGYMYSNPIWWHSHEMLIGFTGAIIIGFLLTAVQNWTGNPGVRGWKLATIFAFWLTARLGMFTSTPHVAWMVIDLVWLPLAAGFLAHPIIVRRQWNNLFFAPLIVLMTVLNALFHVIALGESDISLRAVSFATVMVISVIVLVVGGRVIPFFTWRGTQTEQITRIKGLEYGALLPSWLLLLNVLLPLPEQVSAFTLPALLAVTGIMHLIRFVRWRTLSTIRVPLLWLLHFAYLAMIVGMVLLAVHYLTGSVDYSVALHVMTVGGIGCMILAMIARVSLGHTGRALQIKPVMVGAFVALVLATLSRTLLIAFQPTMTIQGYIISAGLWALAFTIFTVVYFPILSKPRIDGRPG